MKTKITYDTTNDQHGNKWHCAVLYANDTGKFKIIKFIPYNESLEYVRKRAKQLADEWKKAAKSVRELHLYRITGKIVKLNS